MTGILLTDDARQFLQKPLIAYLTTITPEDYPHTVPVWFALDGDEIAVIAVRSTRKVAHIQANPRGAVTIGGGPGDGGGYLLQGDLRIEEDPDDIWMKRLIYRYESGDQAEKDIAAWTPLDIIVIRLAIRRAIAVA